MKYILPNKNDVLYIYIEQWFTGFAPCFDDNLYSLACCMGNINNGGMKASVCKNVNNGKNVWVLSVAGQKINITEKKGDEHNCSDICYSPYDMICLANVNDTYTWEEYYDKLKGRQDAIYRYNNGKIECVDSSVHTIENAKRDCALNHKDSHNLKQIFTSEYYYIFKAGNKLPVELTKNRNYTYKNNNPELIQKFISKNNIAFFCENPFDITIKQKGGCNQK